MKQNKNRTLLCAFALILLALVVVLGWVVNGAKPERKTQTLPEPTVTTVTPSVAHPAEGELNKLGLTLSGGITVHAGTKNEQKGESTK